MLVRRLEEAPVEEWHRLRSHVLMDAGELGSRNMSVTWLEVPAGAEQTLRSHEEAEQVYVVVRGSGRMKLDDEIVELREWDAVRIPPGTWRGYEAGPDGLEIIVTGAPSLGEDRRADVEGQRDWWTD
jgi:mannose-6-phosphate isomerase-like protein (cupin superfamily)